MIALEKLPADYRDVVEDRDAKGNDGREVQLDAELSPK
jgi:hypothetical protein